MNSNQWHSASDPRLTSKEQAVVRSWNSVAQGRKRSAGKQSWWMRLLAWLMG